MVTALAGRHRAAGVAARREVIQQAQEAARTRARPADPWACAHCGRRSWSLDTATVIDSRGKKGWAICGCGFDRWLTLDAGTLTP